jgi:O-antigen/teichoic acid export membrane protein
MDKTQQRTLSKVGKKAGKNAMAGMVATAIYFLSRIALTPIILTYISLTDFGLWSICFVILSYAAVGAVGINTAYVKFTAQYHAEDNLKGINSLFSTGMVFMVLFALIFYTTIHFIHPWLLTLFHVKPESMAIASFMVMGTTLVFCIDFTMGGFRSILEGLQEIAFTKSVNVGASVFEVILIVIFLPLGMGIKGLLYAYGIKTVAEMLICTLFVFKKLPGFSIRISLINTAAFKELFVYVGKVQVLGAISIFNASLARFVIASFMGLAGTGLFEIGRKFPFTGRNISRAAFGPFFPAASYLGGQWKRGDLAPIGLRVKKYLFLFIVSVLLGMVPVLIIYILNPMEHPFPMALLCAFIGLITAASTPLSKWLHRNFKEEDQLLETELQTFYLKGLRLLAMLNATVFGFLMAVATPLITCWVGHEYLGAVGVMVIISLSNMIHLCTGPATLVFRGINRSGREFEYLIIQLMTALLWIPTGTHFMGIIGASLGVFASSTVGSLFLFWRTNQAFSITFRQFFKTVVIPTMGPLSVAMAVYGITLVLPVQSRIIAGVEVMVLGIFHLALTFVLLWKYFLTTDETTPLMNMIKRRLPRKQRG